MDSFPFASIQSLLLLLKNHSSLSLCNECFLLLLGYLLILYNTNNITHKYGLFELLLFLFGAFKQTIHFKVIAPKMFNVNVNVNLLYYIQEEKRRKWKNKAMLKNRRNLSLFLWHCFKAISYTLLLDKLNIKFKRM